MNTTTANIEAESRSRQNRTAAIRAKMNEVIAERIGMGWELLEKQQADTGSAYLRFVAVEVVRRQRHNVMDKAQIPYDAINQGGRGAGRGWWYVSDDVLYNVSHSIRISDHGATGWRAEGIHEFIDIFHNNG